MNVFEEHLNSEDLEKRERAKLWRTSIGLQTLTVCACLTSLSANNSPYLWNYGRRVVV